MTPKSRKATTRPRKATRIQAAARRIKAALADDSGLDYQESFDVIRVLADQIIEMADRQDARTGRLDPRLRSKRKAK